MSLNRRVALRLIDAERLTDAEPRASVDDDLRRAAAVHHPNLVPVYASGDWDGGRFVASRLVRGTTLADLRGRGAPFDATTLAGVRDALAAAHRDGLTHGRVAEHNVLVDRDGTPYLADLGLGRGGDRGEDERALAALIERAEQQTGGSRPRLRRPVLAAGAAVIALGGIAAAVLARDSDEPETPASATPVQVPNTRPIGSTLAAAPTGTMGCAENPTPNTSACTLAQADEVIERAGVVRAWSVRGAFGDVALQIIRMRDRQAFEVGFTQPQSIDGSGVHSYRVEVPVRAGDRIAAQLGPGAEVGVGETAPGARILLWDGGLTATPQSVDARSPGGELMLRADVDYGATVEGPRQLEGPAAAAAADGRVLGELQVGSVDGEPARVEIVSLRGAIALDLLSDERVARLFVPDADPQGRFLGFSQGCGRGGANGFCMRWHNPGSQVPLQHAYEVLDGGTIRLVG